VEFGISDSAGALVIHAVGVPVPADALTELIIPPRR